MVEKAGSNALIVIPCLDEAANLPRLLAALVAEAPDARIVVADGGSRDDSRAIVARFAEAHPNVVLLDNPARVQSAGVNAAVRAHGGERRWLVRVDAHCGYPASYVAELLAAAERTGADAVVVPMRTRGRGCFQRAAAAAQNSWLGTGGSPHRHLGAGRFVDHGHHALCALARFRAAGGYDECFSHNEDAELDHRLRAAGARIWLEPAAAIDYFPRGRPLALLRQYYRYGIGRAMTLQRHRMAMKLRQTIPLAIAPLLALALLAPLWWPFALPAAGWAMACLLLGAVEGLRLRDRCAMLCGCAAMLMHAGWSVGFWRQRLFGRTPGRFDGQPIG